MSCRAARYCSVARVSLAEERVWAAVRRIPRGQVATYGEIGAATGCTARQVGSALRRAGSERRLPWHRVVAAEGRIALPGSAGLEQRLRLEQEGVPFRGKRVWLERCRSQQPA
ncbi:MAG: MGMT family protein [Acidobacteria bacterium]|nr:MGMT family protein [Acidobacteriota bacterium]MDA1233807.1 MGMT family protein [Acidobacteriota bacterium]